jgi:hypothetical protein
MNIRTGSQAAITLVLAFLATLLVTTVLSSIVAAIFA